MKTFSKRLDSPVFWLALIMTGSALCSLESRAAVIEPPYWPPYLPLSLSASPSDAGQAHSVRSLYYPNETVTVSATPYPWTTFSNWTENGVVVSTSTNYSFIINSSRSLVANFLTPEKFTIALSASPADAGSVGWFWHSPQYYLNEPATVVASQNSSVFINWTENGAVVSTEFHYSFIVASNRSLVANFRPFFQSKVRYAGLVCPTNDAVEGSGTIALECNELGHFVGTLYSGKRKYRFDGVFAGTGNGFHWSGSRGEGDRDVWYSLQYSWDTDQFSGTVSQANWTSEIRLERQLFDSRTNPAPHVGTYTLIIPGNAEGSAQPQGNSYATMSVASSGSVRLAGSMADGTKFSTAAVLSNKGRCPLFIPLYGGRGLLTGWINFNDNPAEDIAGNLIWLKPSSPYADGFAVEITAIGSAYVPPVASQQVLDLDHAQVSFRGGGLSTNLTQSATFMANNKVLIANGTSGNMVISPRTGLFRGQFKDSLTSRKIPFNGVVLQNYGIGRGYFLHAGESGSVELAN